MTRNPSIRPNGDPIGKPTPREIKALKAVENGDPLTRACKQLGITAPALASILSRAYTRLGVKDLAHHHLSQSRRALAIKICKHEGWWPDDDQSS